MNRPGFYHNVAPKEGPIGSWFKAVDPKLGGRERVWNEGDGDRERQASMLAWINPGYSYASE